MFGTVAGEHRVHDVCFVDVCFVGRTKIEMNRIRALALVVGCAVAASGVVRILRTRREAVEANAALRLDIERFENEGGRVSPT